MKPEIYVILQRKNYQIVLGPVVFEKNATPLSENKIFETSRLNGITLIV